MSNLKTSYCLSKTFSTKKELTKLIDRINRVTHVFSICEHKLRSHTRFHILDNISNFLIVVSSEIEWSCIE